MGMEAKLIAVGKFSKDIVDHLNYTSDHYDNMEEGTDIVVEFLGCPTENTSRALADILGVEPWDFNTHAIDPAKMKFPDGFKDRLAVGEVDDEFDFAYPGEWEALFAFLNHGFKIFYMPEG